MDRIRRLSKIAQDEFGVTIKSKSPTGETFESLYCNTKNDDRKEKHIEEMTKFVCMDCRYFMQCNDDTMYDGRPLSEVMKEDCWTQKNTRRAKMAKNRYAVYARRVDKKHWSDWCKVKTLDRAEEHSEKVRELGFKSKIYDTKEKKTIKKDD